MPVEQEILISLGRLHEKVDTISRRVVEDRGEREKLEDRVGKVEKKQAYVAGGLALACFIIPVAAVAAIRFV